MHKGEKESSWVYWKLIWSKKTGEPVDDLGKDFGRIPQVFGFLTLLFVLVMTPVFWGTITWLGFFVLSQIFIWVPVYCYWQEDKWERGWNKRNERGN